MRVSALRRSLLAQHHGLRTSGSRRERVLKLYQGKYGDFGPTLGSEYLLNHDGEKVGIETLRQWLVTAGLWSPRRRGATHRQWRAQRSLWRDGPDGWFVA